jgi:hypothetical protein
MRAAIADDLHSSSHNVGASCAALEGPHALRSTPTVKPAFGFLRVCIATFEPLIQVKSEAVDTGRDLVPSGHVV